MGASEKVSMLWQTMAMKGDDKSRANVYKRIFYAQIEAIGRRFAA